MKTIATISRILPSAVDLQNGYVIRGFSHWRIKAATMLLNNIAGAVTAIPSLRVYTGPGASPYSMWDIGFGDCPPNAALLVTWSIGLDFQRTDYNGALRSVCIGLPDVWMDVDATLQMFIREGDANSALQNPVVWFEYY